MKKCYWVYGNLCVNIIVCLTRVSLAAEMEGKLKLVPLSFPDASPFSMLFLCVSYSEKKLLSGNCLLNVLKSYKCHLYVFLRTPSSLRACLLLFPKRAFLLIGEINVPFFRVCT